MQIINTDVLVVGAGLAGERAAIEASSYGNEVIMLSLVPPRRSHSAAAAGGMQASLGNVAKAAGDNPDIHFADTVKGSDWGCDQDRARLFANLAPVAVRQMSYWGCPWNRVVAGKKVVKGGEEVEDSREKEGLIAARDFGGVSKWRACYVADGTGHALLYTLDSVVCKMGIKVHDRMEAFTIIHDGEKCYGVIAQDLRTGKLIGYTAKATVIATGGYGRLYGHKSTNAVINDGTGMSICMDTGIVPLGNMEAVQFHPTGLYPVSILMTEGCRGDGGHLLDKNNYRFMPDYEPNKKELASRDVVSRRMVQHMRAGNGLDGPDGPYLLLDIRHLGKKHIETNLRDVAEMSRDFIGVDPVTQPIPVRPTQHYSMGGIRTEIDGRVYGLKGLYAAGETACWDMHGFNRLGGNSVAETIVMGMVVGEAVGKYCQEADLEFSSKLINDFYKQTEERMNNLKASTGKENSYQLHKEMADVLCDNVHVFRNGEQLQKAVDELQKLHERSKNLGLSYKGPGVNPGLAHALRIPGMIRVAMCIAYGGLQRTESRGSHFREDYPKRDDANWLSRTLAYWPDGNDLPKLEYEKLNVEKMEMPPGDRGYGEATKGPEKKDDKDKKE